MFTATWRRWRRRACAGRGAVVAAGALLLVAACALSGSGPGAALVTSTASFPRVAPTRLAHVLADFSSHLRLYPHLEDWTVEEESSNYSAWHYTVSYTCGARCSGRATVLALDEQPEHEHVATRAHTIHVKHRSCSHPPLPLWPDTCDEWETETHVSGDGAGGAVLRERVRGACGGGGAWGAARALLPAAAPLSCTSELRGRRDHHLQRLRALLHEY